MKKILLYFIIVSLALSGCKNWLDINYSPNDTLASNVTIDFVLPATQSRIAALLNSSNNSLYNQSFLAHHLTKSGSVGGTYNFLTGLLQPQDANYSWQELYSNNANLVLVKEKALELNSKAYEGVARALLVHNFQNLVDMFGNVPYSEALLGRDPYQPKYDKAEDIYANLLTEIDLAIACFVDAKSAEQQDISRFNNFASVDVMAGGNIDKWNRFAHSLKLRLLIRVSGVQNVASQIEAIKDKCLAWNEVMECNPGYRKESNKMKHWSFYLGWNHLNQEQNGHTYYRPTRDFVDMLRDNNDPRLRVYVQPRRTLTNDPDGLADYAASGLETEPYIGIPYGQQNPPENTHTGAIGPGILFLSTEIDPTTNAPIMGGFEVSFYLAEAALKGYVSGGDAAAKSYYEQGVTGVFKYLEVPLKGDGIVKVPPGYPSGYAGTLPAITGSAEDAAAAYLSQPGNTFCNWDLMNTDNQKLNAIASQKWISLFGVSSIEAWSEFRRLDLPELGSSRQAQVLYNISILPYPQTEINLNYDNYISNVTGRTVTETLLFWDVVNPQAPKVPEYL